MARILAWCDHPHAPTGFGRSANHVLYALHEQGHELTQLAVNADPQGEQPPWRLVLPGTRGRDPYGTGDLPDLLKRHRFDAFWTTFDPEVPWRYPAQGTGKDCLHLLAELKQQNPGFRMLGWFPVDGGPLSDLELAVLGFGPYFDVHATMASHVHELVADTVRKKGGQPDMEKIAAQIPVVPHGVDLSLYTIPTPEQRAQAKREMGVDPDTFVVLQLERNQQRKQNYLAFHVMEHLFKRDPALRGKVLLYQHMLQDEENHSSTLGFNLPELAWRYDLRAGVDVKWPGGFVPEETLRNVVYRAADAFLSVSTGEGFQYPAWEALACGIPLVVPNTDARRAWFKAAPNVQLYGADEQLLVMRGGYHRRMNMPRPHEAASILQKLVKGKRSVRPAPEAGRNFVARHADVDDVRRWWVDQVEEQLDMVAEERIRQKIVDLHVTNGHDGDVLVDCSPAFGLGDTVLAAPAIRALRDATSQEVWWALPKANVTLATLLDAADGYPVEKVGAMVEANLHLLYHPHPTSEWTDPTRNRTEFIAGELAERFGLSQLELKPARLTVPREAAQQVRAQFQEQFGVHPTECVAISVESGSPHRSLPKSAAVELSKRVLSLGLTPMLVGREQLQVRHVGVANLTGQLDLPTLAALLGEVGVFVGPDSGPLYLAAAQDTPVVGVFTCVHPDARLRWVGEGPKASVCPPGNVELAGQRFPAGPFPKAAHGEWSAQVSVESISNALADLLGVQRDSERVVAPDGAEVDL